MALVNYLDGNENPAINANGYISLSDADLFLAHLPSWNILEKDEKENKIKQATALLDSLEFAGNPAEGKDMQTLQFPRTFGNDTTTGFSMAVQKRRIRRAVCAQIEYNLNRQGLGALQFSRGDLSATIPQETLCRAAKMALSIYME